MLPIGGKYTTSRCDAIEIVDRVQKALGQKKVKSTTHAKRLPGAPKADDFDEWLPATAKSLTGAGLDGVAASHVAHRHGTRSEEVLKLVRKDGSLAQRVHPDAPFVRAEVKLAFRDEMALSADDALRRRMPLALLVPDLRAARKDAETLRTAS